MTSVAARSQSRRTISAERLSAAIPLRPSITTTGIAIANRNASTKPGMTTKKSPIATPTAARIAVTMSAGRRRPTSDQAAEGERERPA